jgi:ferredoxin-NADP reductase
MLDGPDGDMVLDENDERPAVLLAGGIGITPFLAMARHALEIDLERHIHLFYASRRPEEAAYLQELSEMPMVNTYFHLIPTMSAPSESAKAWRGETGHIDAAMLSRYLPDLLAPVYYFAGPPAMTDAMDALLAEIGVAEADRHYETFLGY